MATAARKAPHARASWVEGTAMDRDPLLTAAGWKA